VIFFFQGSISVAQVCHVMSGNRQKNDVAKGQTGDVRSCLLSQLAVLQTLVIESVQPSTGRARYPNGAIYRLPSLSRRIGMLGRFEVVKIYIWGLADLSEGGLSY
jgi:hypothetical protein